jgi:hypothetical protein
MASQDEAACLTREQAVELLNRCGFPIGKNTFDRLCSPSVQQGPAPAYFFNKRPLYRPGDVLAWARARSSPAGSDVERVA